MTSLRKSAKKGLFFCLGILLFLNTRALGLDERMSFALSHYILGVMYDDLGDIDKAIPEYKKALKADKKNALIHLKLAADYLKKSETKNNKIEQAINELSLAIKFDPEAVEPHAILALIYSSQNKPELAASEYEISLKNASKLQPKNIDIYKNLGAIYLQQKRFKEAQNAFRLILDLSKDDADAYFYLGNIYDELKDKAQAEAQLEKSLQLKPDYHEALNYLGYLYVEENKNLDRAEVMIKKALEFEPDNGAYVDSLGWLYFKQGRFKEAHKELERASLLLEDPVIFDHLGDVYFKMGDREKAKLNWQKSLKLKPDQDKVKEKLNKNAI